MAAIELAGLVKTYSGGVAGVRGIDLVVADGEFVVIVGPSGCGKSTLLRLVAGLESVSAGTITIGGRDVTAVEPADRNIAMVFQNYALYPHMSVYDNMAYGLRNRKTPGPEIERRVREAARILELAPLLDRKPRQLSGGQRQRVAMGRAIVREPAAFLFDEPLSNLDAKLRVQMRGEIKRLQRRVGVTSLYVTHDQAEAMTMADRLVVMNAGLAEQIGPPLELYRDPATLFVAGFIGSPAMNLLPGEMEEGGIRLGAALLPGPPGATGTVTVGIRPEHLRPAGGVAVGDLLVELVEPLGGETLIHGNLDGHPLVVRVEGGAVAGAGSRLPLAVDAADLRYFDAASGRRLR